VTLQGEPPARFSRFDHVNVCTKPCHGHDVKDGMSGIWRRGFGVLSICGDHSGSKVQRT
jgi:hypothetical protein